HRGLRGGGRRRHGLDSRCDHHRLHAGDSRRVDQGVLSRGLEHRHLCGHGDRAAGAPGRPDGEGCLMNSRASGTLTPTKRPLLRLETLLILVGVAALALAPFYFYPIFIMKVLCFALFACAFNLLLGYAGILSFGHAAFFGGAAYFTAHAVKEWGLTPELGILVGVAG